MQEARADVSVCQQHGGKVTKVERYDWVQVDNPGQFRLIHKDELIVDRSYQRDIVSQSKVLAIAKAWSWVSCGVIIVGLRDGRFFVIDGQHRTWAALRRSDISRLPCMVFQTKDSREESERHVEIQETRVSLRSYDKYKNLLLQEKPEAVLVNRLVQESGRRISNETTAHTISCVATLLKYAKQEPQVLGEMWQLVTDVCRNKPLHTRIFEGIMYIESKIRPEHSLMQDKWKKRLLKIGYDELLDSAGRACAFYAKGGAKVYASGMIEAINKGLKDRLEMSS